MFLFSRQGINRCDVVSIRGKHFFGTSFRGCAFFKGDYTVKEKSVKRIVIGGCRTFTDYDVFKEYLDGFFLNLRQNHQIVILSGHCRGVDAMAEKYAKENGFSLEIHPAEWEKYGRAAGPKRNEKMVLLADCVIAFWDGKSRGTKSLISFAEDRQKPMQIKNI